MLQSKYRISIVVRARDVESRFGELMRSLSLQTLLPSELVIVDNLSTKERFREMQAFLLRAKRDFFNDEIPVMLVPLTDREFSHAYSTNVGVFVASGDLVCITNAHSLPSSNGWLESGTVHFKHEEVAGVGGYAVPHEDGTFWEKLAYDWGWRRLYETSKAYVDDDYFSTTNCILRKSLWEVYPFDEKLSSAIPSSKRFGGEDYDWSKEMLARGYRIIVEPKFSVRHSHKEDLPILFSKYVAWRRIRKRIGKFRRPRKSYTRVMNVKPKYYAL